MSAYKRYLVQRATTYIVVIFIALIINFAIPRLIPGDPIRGIIQRMTFQGTIVGKEAEELVKEWRAAFGLDGDYLTQFIAYLRELVKGNMGYSIILFPTTVNELIARSLPWTIGLLAVTATTSWILGNLIGAVAGWKGGRLARNLAPIAVVLGNMPYYLLAIILIYFLSYTLDLLPRSGGFSIGAIPSFSIGFMMDVIWHSILPMLSIIVSSLGWWFLSMRSMMVTLKGEDYILMAEAKGLSEKRIMWKYAFRNCLLPQVTGLALSLGNIMGGALIMEMIFAYPGVGWLLYYSIQNLDYPVIQGVVLLVVFSVCTALLFIDLIYPLIDPKIKYGVK